jgi:hypothetical protein
MSSHLHVLPPVARRLGELRQALERVAPQRRGEALVEARRVAPHAPVAVLDRDAVGPADTAGVEVLQHQPFAGLRGADDADRIGELLVVGVGALEEKVTAFEPLERGGHGLGDGNVLALGVPGADQGVELLERGISFSHVVPPS